MLAISICSCSGFGEDEVVGWSRRARATLICFNHFTLFKYYTSELWQSITSGVSFCQLSTLACAAQASIAKGPNAETHSDNTSKMIASR